MKLSELIDLALPSSRAPSLQPMDHWHYKSYRRLPEACPVGFCFADLELCNADGRPQITTYAVASRNAGYGGRPEFIEVNWAGKPIDLDAPNVWSARLETIAAAAWEASATIANARKIIVASAPSPS